jgi:hypothetical protein
VIRLILAWLVVWLGVPVVAFAQHPCDLAVPTEIQVRRADHLQATWCFEAVDDAGDSIPLGATRFALVSGTTELVDLGMTQPTGGPNAAGAYYYVSTATLSVTQDVSVRVSATYNGVTAVSVTPFFIDIRGGPKPPSGVRIIILQP